MHMAVLIGLLVSYSLYHKTGRGVKVVCKKFLIALWVYRSANGANTAVTSIEQHEEKTQGGKKS